MDIFSFSANFGSEQACRLDFKEQGKSKELYVKYAIILITIGNEIKKVLNVKNTDLGHLYGVGRLCRARNHHFLRGIRLCF